MKKGRIKTITQGRAKRLSYSRINEVLEMPNLIEVQKNSYKWFLEEGLKEVFEDISPIADTGGNLSLELVDFKLDEKSKYSIQECKDRDATYAKALRVKVRLRNATTDEIKENEIFMGDFPVMTDTGTFIINGAERVIVSQLVRSPGVYYKIDYDKFGKKLFHASVIPSRGAWIEYETDSNNVMYVRVDRARKMPATVLLRALGLGEDEDILNLFGEDQLIMDTLEKDTTMNSKTGLEELYKKIRPGEPFAEENARSLINSMFYDPKRYDLAKIGRYKFNKKLSYKSRVKGFQLSRTAVDMDGEVIAEKGEVLTASLCDELQNKGVAFVYVQSKDGIEVKVLSNMMVSLDHFLGHYGITATEYGIKENVHHPALDELIEKSEGDIEELKLLIKQNVSKLVPKNITFEDIIVSVNYVVHLSYGVGFKDDIDHLGNRRIRAVGELLQNQFRIGLTRMERVVRERMVVQDSDNIVPSSLINIRPVTAAIKEFFGSSQLSQFMEQTNPLGELTHKRRMSALGPGGLNRDRAGFEVRDVHSSHYGRMCPIETPEGPNIGLINSLATYARINEYGFIEAPYRLIKKDGEDVIVSNECQYITADEEEEHIVAQANVEITEDNRFESDKVTSRLKEDVIEAHKSKVSLMDVSPKQMVSVATALIPFLENDDVTRALMGSNMQRQAVPLLQTDSPIVGTGMEHKVAYDSGVCVLAEEDGIVSHVASSKIEIKNEKGKIKTYRLTKFKRSNQSTCLHQKPLVSLGDVIKKGDIIADGPSTQEGELALGRNPLIAFMTWEGYNYEDAILLSENLIKDDVYTSIHIEEYEAESRDSKLGPEEITRDIPNVSEEAKRFLDRDGIISIGAEVRPNDILVGKVTPKGETELSAEERLLRAIFGEKAREVRDSSLRVPHGEGGTIVDVKVFTREAGDELPPGVNKVVRVYLAQKRKISVGDKMAGRHGNKGVISRVLPEEDMPFLPNGRPVDIVLNPLGVPSRMNIGQVLEVHLGLAAKVLGFKVATPVFDGANEIDIMDTLELADDFSKMPWDEFTNKWGNIIEPDIMEALENNKDNREEWKDVPITRDGKIHLRDGRTGEYFDNPVTVGYMHYLKLHHLVDDKIHARSTGPYSLVTQQPLGGKAQFGGQRFGEMEVWALEAYGASYTLQEILTVKSDDIVGRVKTYEAIVKGENIPEPGVPESFKVLLKELQALSLDVQVLLEDSSELELRETLDDTETSLGVNMYGEEERDNSTPFVRKSEEILRNTAKPSVILAEDDLDLDLDIFFNEEEILEEEEEEIKLEDLEVDIEEIDMKALGVLDDEEEEIEEDIQEELEEGKIKNPDDEDEEYLYDIDEELIEDFEDEEDDEE
ncbi:MAG: DNA-directed RNA polymerase subunit beta [Defluviitaleaceae bacterium]|nr:DNA-directed RNA polymerase subunit beta [Defluviitaleaceae bacterium]